ncbi:carboxypeptidase regulatory-like domain-containing protein [Candidatus Sumerlaeota bacterium]|nr:carboxypeptidase regulatory-like domain-containing protein [Candidatus Sumerlaeota bacterium]
MTSRIPRNRHLILCAMTALIAGAIGIAPRAAVEFTQIERQSQALQGPWSEAAPGDWIIREPDGGLTLCIDSQGRLIDIARKTAPVDFFSSFAPAINGSANQWKNVVIQPNGLELIVEAEWAQNLACKMKTRYALDPRAYILSVATTLSNEGEEAAGPLQLGDQINWGLFNLFIPETKSGLQRNAQMQSVEFDAPWIAGTIDHICLGLLSDQGRISGKHANQDTQLVLREVESLPPGESVEYTRRLRIGTADLGLISNMYYGQQERGITRLEGQVIDNSTKQGVAGAMIQLLMTEKPTDPDLRHITIAESDEAGFFNLALPAGHYHISVSAQGYRTQTLPDLLDLKANDTRKQTFAFSDAVSQLKIRVKDKQSGEPLPCKLVFESTGNSPAPRLGPMHGFPAAYNVLYVPEGEGQITLSPGAYRIFVMRGPEYSIDTRTINIRPGQISALSAELEHQIDTPGMASCALGLRTNRSDGLLTPEQQLQACLCEGLDAVVGGDVNTWTDLQAAAQKAGLSEKIAVYNGVRIIPEKAGAYGEYFIFPVEQDPKINGLQDRVQQCGDDSEAALKLLRETFPRSLIGVGKLAEENGYFRHFGYPGELKNPPQPGPDGASYNFDMIEVFTDKFENINSKSHQSAYDILKRRHSRPIFASSFGRIPLLEEPGYPRMYVACAQDNPASFEQDELFKHMRANEAYISNGPILDVQIDGKPSGSLVSPDENGSLWIHMRIYAPQFADISTLVVLQNGNTHWMTQRGSAGDGVLKYPLPDVDPSEFSVKVTEDGVITIAAVSAKLAYPLLTPMFTTEGSQPANFMAVSGQFFVDANRDGKFNPPSPGDRRQEDLTKKPPTPMKQDTMTLP